MTLQLSVLDQSPLVEGHRFEESFTDSLALAEAVDALGYTRYWVAEHHRSASFAGSAPEVLATALLSRTRHLRVGTGGVLLPRYHPLKVAEVFQVLGALFPGRVDAGIGRAGGPAPDFDRLVTELDGLIRGEGVPGLPEPLQPPRLWLLGAGGSSAGLAGGLGAGYAFGHFFNPRGAAGALRAYRQELPRRSAGAEILAVRVVAADSAERAAALAEAMLLWRARKDLGVDGPVPSPDAALGHRWTGDETRQAAFHRPTVLHGTAVQVHDRLSALAGEVGVRELMVNTLTRDPSDRTRSYELLAGAFALPRPSDTGSGAASGTSWEIPAAVARV